jgi:hypothetical protein
VRIADSVFQVVCSLRIEYITGTGAVQSGQYDYKARSNPLLIAHAGSIINLLASVAFSKDTCEFFYRWNGPESLQPYSTRDRERTNMRGYLFRVLLALSICCHGSVAEEKLCDASAIEGSRLNNARLESSSASQDLTAIQMFRIIQGECH